MNWLVARTFRKACICSQECIILQFQQRMHEFKDLETCYLNKPVDIVGFLKQIRSGGFVKTGRGWYICTYRLWTYVYFEIVNYVLKVRT